MNSLKKEDIVIRRVTGGWILINIGEDQEEQDGNVWRVFQDTETAPEPEVGHRLWTVEDTIAYQNSLVEMLKHAFDYYCYDDGRSSGISITVEASSKCDDVKIVDNAKKCQHADKKKRQHADKFTRIDELISTANLFNNKSN